MYWEAIAFFGTATLVVAFVVSFALLWLFRWLVPKARRGRRVDKAGLVGAGVGVVLALAVGALFGFAVLVVLSVILLALDFGMRRSRSKRKNGNA